MLRCLLLYLIVNYNFECLVSIKVPVRDPEVRKNEPPDHIIPYTSHEHVPEPKYVPGNWLKPLKNRTKLDFTPQRLYSQVRRSSSVKKVPRKEALRRAQTDIEKEEAARLKESVSDKKINTFYTEEGFEDAAYDHAGHIRDADFKENYEQDQGKHRVKGLELKRESEDSDSEEEPRKNFYNSWQESGERTRTKNRFDDDGRNRGRYDKIIYPRKNSGGFGVSPRLIVENEIDLLKKDIEREEKEAEKGAETEVPENLRELKDSDYDEEEEEVGRSSEDYQDDEDSFEYGGSSKFRIVAAEHPATAKPVDSYVGSVYTTTLPKRSLEKQVLVVNGPKFDRREEKKNVQNLERSEENYVYPTLAQIYETWKRRGVERMYESGGESAEDVDKKLNRMDEIKKPKKTYLVMVRPKIENNGTNLEPKKKSVFSTTESGLQENVKPVPSYRYQRKQKESRLDRNRDKLVAMTKMVPPSLTSRSEYAEYHNLRRNGSTQPQHDRPRMVKALSHQSALRFGRSRPRYLVTGREKGDNEKVSEGWKNNRFISRKFVILRKKRGVFSAPIVVDEVVDGELEKRFPEEGEDRSGEESLEVSQEEEEEQKVEAEVPEFNFAEVVAQNNKSKNASNDKGDADAGIDEEKYPFYNLMEHSTALKYVINPSFVPRKTLGGSEFYDSRDKYMNCEDVEPDLSEEVPEKEPETTEKNLPRLKGLGDKLLCLKEKYFDEEPLDNPLFVEKQIEPPTVPTELDPEALRARFEGLTKDYEDNSLRRMSGPVDLRSVESRIEESGDKQEGKWNNHAKKYRKRKQVSPTVSPYQREVYDDVMGTIKNLATMYKGVHVLSTRPPPKKKRQDSREKNDQVRINTSSRDVVVPLRGRTRHPKLGGYRTNRVSYRTRPMVKGFKGTDGKVVGFFKTVRVHKRDLRNVESNLKNVGIFDSRKIRNVSNSGVEGKNSSREDKNSRPRGTVRFGRFQDPGSQGRRNEPRYTAVRKFDEVYEVETKGQEPKKEVDRYDVHEDVQEAPEKVEEAKEIFKPAANENTENEDTGGKEDDEEEEEGEEEEYEASSGDEEEEDKNDGSEYVEDSGSKSESEEVSADAERNYEEISEGEKEFERFSYRPFSSYESYYDPKYANLGPRVNKPAFHHPSFDSLESKKKDSEESGEYVFPWHEDEEDASEESRKHERFTRRHEYPWERRDRVRRERGKKYGLEWSPSESKTYFRKAYPWERYSVPWKYGGRRGHFWPDENEEERGGKDTYPKSRFRFKKLIGKGRKVDPSTTSTPQIPATEEMAKVEATTPLILTTTTPIAYTIRPRIRRPVTQRSIESLKEDQAKAHSSPRAVKTVPEFRKLVNRGTIKANSSNLEVADGQRIWRGTTTRPSSRKFLDNTTPSSRKVEHRSKVSKEEIITMSFPKMGNDAEVKDNSSAGKIVQKVSILTKETPEHIYRTQEIDKNGVRDTIISVIPNNRTGSLKSMSIDRLDINSNDGNDNNNSNNDQYRLDISLPLNKNLQLTEHGTRKVISSVSWIAENYDY